MNPDEYRERNAAISERRRLGAAMSQIATHVGLRNIRTYLVFAMGELPCAGGFASTGTGFAPARSETDGWCAVLFRRRCHCRRLGCDRLHRCRGTCVHRRRSDSRSLAGPQAILTELDRSEPPTPRLDRLGPHGQQPHPSRAPGPSSRPARCPNKQRSPCPVGPVENPVPPGHRFGSVSVGNGFRRFRNGVGRYPPPASVARVSTGVQQSACFSGVGRMVSILLLLLLLRSCASRDRCMDRGRCHAL
jgi:hypothetical protein